MVSHYWDDDDFDWNALHHSINYCMIFWLKFGRIGSHGKEKFGTFRDHPYFWDGGIHSLLYPGYVRIINKLLYWKIDPIIKLITKYTGIFWLGHKYQAAIYNYAIQKMCKKYPHIIDELVSDLTAYKFIKPGIFGNIDGKKIHNKYWIKC